MSNKTTWFIAILVVLAILPNDSKEIEEEEKVSYEYNTLQYRNEDGSTSIIDVKREIGECYVDIDCCEYHMEYKVYGDAVTDTPYYLIPDDQKKDVLIYKDAFNDKHHKSLDCPAIDIDSTVDAYIMEYEVRECEDCF